jgi:hypothetical protein
MCMHVVVCVDRITTGMIVTVTFLCHHAAYSMSKVGVREKMPSMSKLGVRKNNKLTHFFTVRHCLTCMFLQSCNHYYKVRVYHFHNYHSQRHEA